MKKKLLFILIFISIFSASARASVDINIGGTTWYNWWKPAWYDGAITSKGIFNMLPLYAYQDHRDFDSKAGFLAGPTLSVRFLEKWTISSIFVIGKYHFQSRGFSQNLIYLTIAFAPSITYTEYTREILKWDSDTTIGYNIHPMVKIFAGFKTQGYRYNEELKDVASTDYTFRKIDFSMRSYGTGLGIGFTIPLKENFFIAISTSGLILWGFEEAKVNRIHNFDLATFLPNAMMTKFPQGRFLAYGVNSSLSLGYRFEKAHLTFVTGGRYQLLFNRQNFESAFKNNATQNVINKEYDHFYGITLSAIYTFTIGKK